MLMRHPDLPDSPPVDVDEQAFTLVHRLRGWEAAPDSEDPRLAPAPDPAASTPKRKTAQKEKQP